MNLPIRQTAGVIFLLLFSLSMSFPLVAQQDEKEISQSDARLNMDAYALAYGTCKYELAKFKSEMDPNNAILSADLLKTEKTFRKFQVNINTTYKKNPDQFAKFSKKVKAARKQLPTCINYQKMIDMNENIESSKAEKSQ